MGNTLEQWVWYENLMRTLLILSHPPEGSWMFPSRLIKYIITQGSCSPPPCHPIRVDWNWWRLSCCLKLTFTLRNTDLKWTQSYIQLPRGHCRSNCHPLLCQTHNVWTVHTCLRRQSSSVSSVVFVFNKAIITPRDWRRRKTFIPSEGTSFGTMWMWNKALFNALKACSAASASPSVPNPPNKLTVHYVLRGKDKR